MTVTKDTDMPARERIIRDTDRNFFVEAGAGSGKTTMLVSRMVAMVEAGKDVSKICAITFTKAAAGEFYKRFREELSNRANKNYVAEKGRGKLPPPTDITRERCARALREIDLCFMSTIDAFCNTLISEHPARAQVPSGAAVVNEEDMCALYKREYSAILRGEYGEELKKKAQLFRTVNNRPAEAFTACLGKVMKVRRSEIVYEKPEELTESKLKDGKDLVKSLLDAMKLTPEIFKIEKGDGEIFKIADERRRLLTGNWCDNVEDVLYVLNKLAGLKICKDEKDVDKMFAPAAFVPDYDNNGKLRHYKLNAEELLISRLEEYRYSVTMDLLCSSAEEIAKKLRREGCLTYDDYLYYLRDMLRDDAASGGKLIGHIRGRHAYFLIDEFQDTNPVQAEIFFYLTAKKPDADWIKCVPTGGSLFIVGDPKQSIYRFRQADVTSFLKVKSMFCGEVGDVLTLTRNYRSTYVMRQCFNSAFGALMSKDTDVQSKFSPIPLDADGGQCGSFQGVYYYDVSYRGGRRDEDCVAEIIAKLVAKKSGFTVRGKKDKRPRPVEYGDIMLITYSKAALKDYMRKFVEMHVPFFVEGSVAFSECPALYAVSAVMGALARPDDALSVYAALTSKLFNVTDKCIYSLTADGFKLSLVGGAGCKNAKVKKIVAKLKELYFKSLTVPPSVLLFTILEELHVIERVGADNAEYLYYAIELVRVVEASGQIADAAGCAEYLKKLIGGNSELERSIAFKENANKVQLANLHKVKGLERPIVILAGRQKGTSSVSERTERGEGAKSWLFKLKKEQNFVYAKTGKYAAEERAESESLDAERLRLLYVAATRARNALIVGRLATNDGSYSEKGQWEQLFENITAKRLNVTFTSNPPAVKSADAGKLRREGESKNVGGCAQSREAGFEICLPSKHKVKSVISSEDDYADREDESTHSELVRGDAALIGTMVHKLMEAVVTSSFKVDAHGLILDIVREYAATNEKYVDILKSVYDTMTGGGYGQKNADENDLFAILKSADDVHCEVPFCYRKEGAERFELWNGVIDLVYKKDGAWHIVDYKTDADEDGLSEKHAEQLAAYTEAFKRLTGLDADARIYHIAIKKTLKEN